MNKNENILNRAKVLSGSMKIGDAAYMALREAGVVESELAGRASILVSEMDNAAMNQGGGMSGDAKLFEKLGKGSIKGDLVTLIFKGNRIVTMTKEKWAELCKNNLEPRQIAAKRLA